jgi:hypothetical protein
MCSRQTDHGLSTSSMQLSRLPLSPYPTTLDSSWWGIVEGKVTAQSCCTVMFVQSCETFTSIMSDCCVRCGINRSVHDTPDQMRCCHTGPQQLTWWVIFYLRGELWTICSPKHNISITVINCAVTIKDSLSLERCGI